MDFVYVVSPPPLVFIFLRSLPIRYSQWIFLPGMTPALILITNAGLPL